MSKGKKTEKKKLIRVRKAPCLGKGYATSFGAGHLYFSLVGPQSLEDGKLRVRHQVSNFATCREELCEMPKRFVSFPDDRNIARGKDHVDFGKLRLLMCTSSETADIEERKRGLFSAKRVLNILEEEAGWDEKSIITSVVYEHTEKSRAWLLTGNSNWTRAPQMISLASLIMRVGFKRMGFTSTNMADLKEELKRITNGYEVGGWEDKHYLGMAQEVIVPLMANVDKIFTETPEKYFDKNSGIWNGRGGIRAWLTPSEGSGSMALDRALKKYTK